MQELWQKRLIKSITVRSKMKKNEKGIAIIIAVSCLMVVTLIVLATMKTAEVNSKSSYYVSGKALLRYQTESALSRSLWCYLWDKRKFPSDHNSFGKELTERDEGDGKPWLANSSPYVIFSDIETDDAAIVKIHDAIVGKDIYSKSMPGRQIRLDMDTEVMEDEEMKEGIEKFTYALDDYIDKNEYYSSEDHQYEANDYLAMDVESFPANNKMQVWQEVLWLPGIKYLNPNLDGAGKIKENTFQIIPPRTWRRGPSRNNALVYTTKNAKESFTASDLKRLQYENDFDDAVLEELEQFKKGELLIDDLSSEARDALNDRDRNESGVCTFEVIGTLYNGTISRTLRVTFDCNQILKNKKFFNCWEHIIY